MTKSYRIHTDADLPDLKALFPAAVAIVFHLDRNGEPVSARAFRTLMAAGEYVADRYPEQQAQRPADHVVSYPVLTTS